MVRDADAAPTIRNADDATRVLNLGITLFEKLASDLKALPVPPGDEATVADITAQVSNFAGRMRELGAAAAAGDRRRVNAIEKEGDAMLVVMNEKFGAYGLNVCGE
jgi:hypothetical protein